MAWPYDDEYAPQMPSYAPPMAPPGLMPPDTGGDPYEAQILAQLAGLQAPTMDSSPEPQFNPGGFGGFLEGMSGLENQHGPARTFGEGLVGGFSRGLGSAGTRVASQRQKFEESATKRQAVRDLDHRQATRDYQSEKRRLFGDLGKVRSDERKDKKTAAEAAAKYITAGEAAKAYPSLTWLQRVPPEQPIERAALVTDVAKTPDLKQIEAESAARARGTASVEAASQPSGVGLSSPAMNLAARRYLADGSLPPLGMGKAAAKDRHDIIEMAAKIDPEASIAANRANYQSNQAALTNLRRTHSSAKAFEATALKNVDVLEAAMKKITNTGSPLLNKPLRMIDRKILGSPEQAAFDVARETVAPEFARLLSSPTAGGQLSDTAREEIRHIVNGDYSIKQMSAAINVLRQDAKNRTGSYEDEIKAIEAEIRNIGTPAKPNPADARTTVSTTPRPGGFFDTNRLAP